MNKYDYIIIGAGSAGCVLANRLTTSGENKVLLIEAGGSDKHILVQMPTALSYPMSMKRYNWGYTSENEQYVNHRRINCPRGKGLGGSSSINGMVYVRGNPNDFNAWEALGAKGWNYSSCIPYFIRAENWQGEKSNYRGSGGPLNVNCGNNMEQNPLYEAFIKAGVEAGYPKTKDYNGYKQEGFGPMQMTVKNGVRASSSKSYLWPIRQRRNLTVITNSLVDKIIFNNKNAAKVSVVQKGKNCLYEAEKEIILSAGAIGSPAILQRSGVGNSKLLKKIGIPKVYNLKGVGKNLMDHLEVYFQFQCKKEITLNSKLNFFNKMLIGMRWIFFKTGLGATNHFESCGFIRSDKDIKYPDIQYHFLPAAINYDGTSAVKGHAFQVHVGPNKPRSRGAVEITSKDPNTPPSITFNYLEHPDDIITWRKCIRLTREIISQPALDCYRGEEIQPGTNITSDEDIDKWVVNNVESAYHPCGTCKMGDKNDEMAVVDSDCRLIGLNGIRVVDSSIFPEITNGNLNAPTIMVAEKVADKILKKSIKPMKIDTWVDPYWKTKQRIRNSIR